MKFTFEQLMAFVAVAEEEHFGRAARRLHITQPPLSRQIRRLEGHLGLQLFDRSGQGARLTPAGTAFLVEARRLVAMAHHATDVAGSISEGAKGTLHLGFTSVVANAMLPILVPAAAERLPEVTMVLHEIRTAQQAEALRLGLADICLGRAFDLGPDLESTPLPPDDLVVALPPGFAATAVSGSLVTPDPSAEVGMSLHDLDGRDFIMYIPASPSHRHLHDSVRDVLERQNVRPRVAQRVMEVYTMLSLVDVGLGAAIVPRSTMSWAGPNTRFATALELLDSQTHSLATWRRDSMNPVVPRLLEIIRELSVSAETAVKAEATRRDHG